MHAVTTHGGAPRPSARPTGVPRSTGATRRRVLGACLAAFVFASFGLSGCGGRRDASRDPSKAQHLEVGTASWYGDPFTGRPTATGEIYDPSGITAASRTLPLGAVVRVTNLRNGRTALVRINDRGPYVGQRILDCSEGLAHELGFHGRGLTPVAIDWPKIPAEPKVQAGAAKSTGAVKTKGAPTENGPAEAGESESKREADRPRGEFWVHLGAYENTRFARRVRVKALAVVEPVSVQRDPDLVRVHAGPFRKRRHAEKALEKLQVAGFRATLVQFEASGPERRD